ncbi:Asp23/Gls24 family envelope stress response protein [uncultured Corynebacterium sp.]|uniref:Asp23/Gls24 family envelope stress response protein n=1 Tax=uncultured Corynebacterium sp. TaxID=159447 RepID=UPI0025CF2229|nr:Asp23/Gls24 family envelope stress response protein [uncultured Corynebacterium sp.]
MDSSEHTTRFGLRAAEHIIGSALAEVPGVTPVDSKLAGLGGRGFPRLMIQMDPTTQTAAVDAAIAVTWPSPVTAVAEAAREAVESALQRFMGYEATRVNIVVGQAVPGTRVTAQDLADFVPRPAAVPQVRAPLADAPIAAPAPAPLRPVSMPAPAPLRPVSMRAAAPVRRVRVTELTPTPAASVSVPAPQPLRAIEVVPMFPGGAR